MLRFPILTLSLIVAQAAQAGTLPAYDPEIICSNIAGNSVRQEMIWRGCLDFQERIRKEITLSWDQVPVTVQESCGQAAQASGDYWRLKSCIDLYGKAEANQAPDR